MPKIGPNLSVNVNLLVLTEFGEMPQIPIKVTRK